MCLCCSFGYFVYHIIIIRRLDFHSFASLSFGLFVVNVWRLVCLLGIPFNIVNGSKVVKGKGTFVVGAQSGMLLAGISVVKSSIEFIMEYPVPILTRVPTSSRTRVERNDALTNKILSALDSSIAPLNDIMKSQLHDGGHDIRSLDASLHAQVIKRTKIRPRYKGSWHLSRPISYAQVTTSSFVGQIAKVTDDKLF